MAVANMDEHPINDLVATFLFVSPSSPFCVPPFFATTLIIIPTTHHNFKTRISLSFSSLFSNCPQLPSCSMYYPIIQRKRKRLCQLDWGLGKGFGGFGKKFFFIKDSKKQRQRERGEVLESEVYSSHARMLKALKRNFQKSTMVPCLYLSLFGS